MHRKPYGETGGGPRKRDDSVETVRRLVDQAETMYYRLGSLLSQIREDRRNGKQPFDPDYVGRDLRIGYRKAMYLISIHSKFSRAGINERQLRGLEWSKAKEIARLPEKQLHPNFDTLANFARKNTRADLIAHINKRFAVRRHEF